MGQQPTQSRFSFTQSRTKESAILTVNQLPDSRRAILIALKQRGSATIAELAAELQLTGEGVRQQLLQLQNDGWIEPKSDTTSTAGRMGRPAAHYRLTAAGDHLFPKNYDVLNVAILDALTDEFGEGATKRLLARISDARVGMARGAMQGLELPERVAQVKNWYEENDPYMEIEPTSDGFRMIERNCPFLNVALRRPSVCSVSTNALTRLMGVRVEREETFQSGHGRCVFHVHADEPIDPDNWKFKLESEIEISD